MRSGLTMQHFKQRFQAAGIAAALGLGLHAAASAPAVDAQEPARENGAARLPSLQQIVKHLDFEEPDAAPNSLPHSFYRYIAPSQGFPPFGSMRLTSAGGYAGEGALEFTLGGGSMSARVTNGVVPILPLTDYSISVRVRTEGLKHARARVGAWLSDQTGEPIHDSRVQSRLAETGGAWDLLTVEINGRFLNAADLIVDLQVVQEAQFASAQRDPAQPRLEDITGRVFFDEVTVSHLPHVSLTMPHAGNLVRTPSVPEVHIQVSELNSAPLTARLQVFNLSGKVEFDSTFPAPRGTSAGILRLPIESCGWYRALLRVTSADGLTRRQWLDFAILPEAMPRVRDARFGVCLRNIDEQSASRIPALIEALACDAATVPVWRKDSGSVAYQTQQATLRELIEQLLRQNVDLTFSLDVVPDALARAAGVQPNQVLELLAMESHLWQPYLDELLVNFGLEVFRWRIGSIDANTVQFARGESKSLAEAARRSFSDFVPGPVLHVAWPIDDAISEIQRLPAYAITLPHHVQPDAFEDYASAFLAEETKTIATIEPLPPQTHTARQRFVDLMIRGLHAWRAGFHQVNIAAPWQSPGADSAITMPDPAFLAWRSLAIHLAARKFIGELPLPAGMHCWILSGADTNDARLVAWSDSVSASGTRLLQSQLAAGPVIVIDAFGNRATVQPSNGVHEIPLGDAPVFIEKANVNLVRFRGGVSIEPDFVPAIAKVHELHVALRNPWNIAVSGSIRFPSDEEWNLSPNVQEFTLPANGEARLPINLIPQRSILAGRKKLTALISLNADQPYSTTVELGLDVGLRDIDLAASWTIEHNPNTGRLDLIVTQAVTNHRDRPVHLDVYLLADGVGQNRRVIAALGSGETAVRLFRIPDGAAMLAGRQVRVGVAERDGLTRLNKLLSIPEQMHVDANDDSQRR